MGIINNDIAEISCRIQQTLILPTDNSGVIIRCVMTTMLSDNFDNSTTTYAVSFSS